nr:hypothetical protein MACL_00001924 [Theileria orientalis]
MNFYRKFLFFAFLYSISYDKLSLLESTNKSASTPKASPSGSSESNPSNSSLASGGRDGQHQGRTRSSATFGQPASGQGASTQPPKTGSRPASTPSSRTNQGGSSPPAIPAGPTRHSSLVQSQSSGTSVTAPKSQLQESSGSKSGTQQSSSSHLQPTDNSQTASKTDPNSKKSTETKTSKQPAAKTQPTSSGSSGPTATSPGNQTSTGGGQTRGGASGSSSATTSTIPKTGGTQPPKTGIQQPSSGQGAGARTTGQPSSQSAGQTSETSVTQPKSSPTSQSQTGSQSSSSSSLPKQSADSQSGNASQQQSTPAARAGSQQPSGQSNRTGQSASSQPAGGVGFQQSAGSPATRTLQSASSPPASPTSGTDGSPKAGETPKKSGVELCIKKNKEATDQFDYKKDNNVVTYTAKEDYGFKLVKQENIEIWKAKDESEYASKVVLDGKGQKKKTVTIHMPYDTKKVFKRENKGKPWIEDNNLVDLDIKNRTSTDYYVLKTTYDTLGMSSVNVYSAKGTYLFNSVKHGSDVIWKAEANICSNKVIVHDSKQPIYIQALIKLPSGNKKFIKEGENSKAKWTDITNQATPDSQ